MQTITTIKSLSRYLIQNSGFSNLIVNNVILSLGYSLNGTKKDFLQLSGILKDCSCKGADNGFSGFIKTSDTVKFFHQHRKDIVSHMEQLAADCGTDIISMVQGFGIFRNSPKPTVCEVGKALWDSGQQYTELRNLYNVFAWYALEEIAHTWYRYIEENPALAEKLSA